MLFLVIQIFSDPARMLPYPAGMLPDPARRLSDPAGMLPDPEGMLLRTCRPAHPRGKPVTERVFPTYVKQMKYTINSP